MSEESLVRLDICFDAEGKHFGNMEVPQSTNSAGWSKYYVPIVSIKNGDGPTAVLFGGNHGDEFEGPVSLMNLARGLDPSLVHGRIIIVPMLNRPAVVAGTRLSPIDGANMNRAFPGNARDSITGMIAHFVSSKILPLADLVIDIHSGGSSTHFLPSVNMHDLENREQMARMLAAGTAWGAPYVFVYKDVAGAGLLPSYAESLGITTLGSEVGSKAQFGPATLKITADGVRNTLRWADVLHDGIQPDAANVQIVGATEDDDYLMSPATGIFEPFVELGDTVSVGDAVGQVHSTELIAQDPITVIARTEGIVMGRRSIPKTDQGELVVVLVRPYSLDDR